MTEGNERRVSRFKSISADKQISQILNCKTKKGTTGHYPSFRNLDALPYEIITHQMSDTGAIVTATFVGRDALPNHLVKQMVGCVAFAHLRGDWTAFGRLGMLARIGTGAASASHQFQNIIDKRFHLILH